MELLKNSRFYILLSSLLLSVLVFLVIQQTVPDFQGQAVKLNELYAFLSVIYLYIALLASPLTQTFKFLPLRGEFIFARRAIGVSAFWFAALHIYFAFFVELQGFSGLGFLSNSYLVSLGLGLIGFLVMTAMAVTSVDWIIDKVTFNVWKILHRFVYFASLLIVLHTLLLGSHFLDLSGTIPLIFFAALAFLLILEALRLDQYLSKKWQLSPHFGLSFTLLSLLLGVGGTYLFLPQSGGVTSIGIHAAHIQLAKQAQQGGFGALSGVNLANLPGAASNPGLIGDPTRRFSVSFKHPDTISPNQDTPLDFEVFDANSGADQDLFSFVYTKVMHLVIVDNELNYFSHIHPTQDGYHFQITTQFPHPGRYHLYIDFQPLGAIEQQFGFTVDVGDFSKPAKAAQTPDASLTKPFGDYTVTLTPSSTPLIGSELSIGEQTLNFRITDTKTHAPVTNLKPYLAAFGHLILINQQTYDYIHVHPTNIVAPKPTDSSGPDVTFLPLGLYGPIKPGIYRAFAQFNPDNEQAPSSGGQLFTSDFTIEVK